MSNRFGKKQHTFLIGKISLSLLAVILLLVLFVLGLSDLNRQTRDRSYESLVTALNRDIVHCYAVEGFYPPSIEYLEQHYGLTYAKEDYMVDYIYEGSNLYPTVTVLKKQE